MLTTFVLFVTVAMLPSYQSPANCRSGNVEGYINPLKAELNPICCLLALFGAHHFLHVSRIRVKSLTLRLLMSYIYMTLVA